MWFGKCFHMRNLSKVTYDKLMTVQNDIGGFQMNYDQFARTLWSKEDLAGSWSLRNKINKFPNCFFMVRNNRGTWRFQCWVPPSYWEYSRVTYDLLVSNIGGTTDLADQLPSNCHLGHSLLVSQSQVIREFSVNLALYTAAPTHDVYGLTGWHSSWNDSDKNDVTNSSVPDSAALISITCK